MVIIRQRKKTAAELKLWYKHYSARRALSILVDDFGLRTKVFMWSREFYTVGRALVNIPGYLLDMRCGRLGVIRFFGGPPGKSKWHEGTILTLLCDATLFEEARRSMTAEQQLMS